jgi:hypothetical protein
MTNHKIKSLTWLSITIITIALWTTVAVLVFGCASCPAGSDPKNVQRWEKKTKFRSAMNRECDSLRHVKMLAMARKY